MLKPFVTFVLLGGSAALASAQSGITTYGVIDAGVVGQRGCTGPCTTKIGSGLASESHIGIQGSEPVSQTTAAIFALETGLRVDTGRADQGERLFGRQAWVGLAGEFGALTIGRQYSLPYLALTDVADPFKGGMAGSASNLIGGPRRVDNSVQYYGAMARGLSAGASYAFKEEVDTSPAGRAWGMTVGIELGPLTVRAAHQNLSAVRVQFNSKTSNDTAARNSIVAANMRLGWGTAYAAYSLSRGWASSPLFNPDNPYGAGIARTPSTSSRDVLLGVAVPAVGRHHFPRFVYHQGRPRPGQPGREPDRPRGQPCGLAPHRFLRGLFAHPQPQRRRLHGRQRQCAWQRQLRLQRRHAPRFLAAAAGLRGDATRQISVA
jgi:hypothetical protein